MLDQGLPPGVEDGDDPQLPAEMPGIVAEGRQRRRRRLEEQVVDRPRVPLCQGVERVGQGEDHVEVLDRQELRPPRREPAFLGQGLALRAVPTPTGVVGNPDRPAAIARFRVPAQGGGPAGRDGPEGAVLPPGQPLGLSHGGPVGADDVGCYRSPKNV